jgi:hypothetical protein
MVNAMSRRILVLTAILLAVAPYLLALLLFPLQAPATASGRFLQHLTQSAVAGLAWPPFILGRAAGVWTSPFVDFYVLNGSTPVSPGYWSVRNPYIAGDVLFSAVVWALILLALSEGVRLGHRALRGKAGRR